MKKIIVALIGIFLLPSALFSQCDSIGRFYYAVTAGIGPSNVRMSQGESLDKKPNFHFHAGALVDYVVFKNFFVESGLTFQHKGYHKTHVGYVDWEKEKFTINYLQIPLTANYRLSFEKVWITPQLGFYYAIGLKGRKFKEGEWFNETINQKIYYSTEENNIYDIKRHYRRFDWGISFGVNVLFIEKYRLGLMYDLGLNNIDKVKATRITDTNTIENSELKSKNGVFSVQLGYYIDVESIVKKLKQKIAEKKKASNEKEIESSSVENTENLIEMNHPEENVIQENQTEVKEETVEEVIEQP